MSITVMKQALEALDRAVKELRGITATQDISEAAQALSQAIEALVQERDALHVNRHAREDVISGLRNEVEMLRDDVSRWSTLCELVDQGDASVVFMGKLDTINTGLEVNDVGELFDQIEEARAALKGTNHDENR